MMYRKSSSIGFQFTVSTFHHFLSIKLPDKGMIVPEQPILNIQIDILSAIIGKKLMQSKILSISNFSYQFLNKKLSPEKKTCKDFLAKMRESPEFNGHICPRIVSNILSEFIEPLDTTVMIAFLLNDSSVLPQFIRNDV